MVGRDLKHFLVPSRLPWATPLDWVTQSRVQTDLKHLQAWAATISQGKPFQCLTITTGRISF